MGIKILEGFWQVCGDGLTHPGDAAAYLIHMGAAAALIDAGTGRGHGQLKSHIQRALPADVPLTHLLLTHCHFDHSGGAGKVRRDFGCRIVAHALDAVYLAAGDSTVTAAAWYGADMDPLDVDVLLEGEMNSVTVGDGELTAIHCPGHSPGSLAYTAEIEGLHVLFGQDIHGPIHPALRSDDAHYQASLKKLLHLDADLLAEGHFGVIRGKDQVRRFIQSYRV